MSEEDQCTLALFTLAIRLAPTETALRTWGREHTALINAQANPVITQTQALFADRLGELKETKR